VNQPRYRSAGLILSVTTVLASAAVSAAPPSPSPEASVLQLLDDWAAAYVKHDRGAIDSILGEDFVMSTGRAELQTRAEYLHKVQVDEEPHASIVRDDERVRVYGDVVLVSHRLTRTTGARRFVFRVTDVCVRREGGWKLVNRHVTEVPRP
jgi:ketosteroid isomerase-like protein